MREAATPAVTKKNRAGPKKEATTKKKEAMML
jgi:hypothetical protein